MSTSKGEPTHPIPADTATPSLISDQAPGAEQPAKMETPIDQGGVVQEVGELDADQPTLQQRVKTLLIGRPRDLSDRRVFHHISLIAFLAWVGLGADGLSSSCYGPAEARHARAARCHGQANH